MSDGAKHELEGIALVLATGFSTLAGIFHQGDNWIAVFLPLAAFIIWFIFLGLLGRTKPLDSRKQEVDA